MKLFQFALLLLVQLSPILVNVNGEAVYKCATTQTNSVTVSDPGAQLTKGCVHDGNGITFDIKAMYDAASKAPVEISISEAAFINSYIKLINGDSIPDTQVPLLFTISKSNMSGTSGLEFGKKGKIFKMPPNSRISIVHSQLSMSSTAGSSYMFTFHGLQLVTNSSIEISHNVITMECKGCDSMTVFYLPTSAGMMISGESSFTVRDNTISMVGSTRVHSLVQYVWYQYKSILTLSETSTYTWASNIISMTGSNVDKVRMLNQYVWYQGSASPLTVSKTSKYKWEMNSISMDGCDVGDMIQFVWYHGWDSPVSISESSNYTLLMNSISINGHDVTGKITQFLWFAVSTITLSTLSHFLFETNKILMLTKAYESIESYVIEIKGAASPVSGGSSVIWRDNCVGMGHKETDKRYMFGVKWSITDKGSELLLDGNYITTTDKYEESGKLTELVWGPAKGTGITILSGELTIRNTKVHSNSAASATGSILWDSSPFTSNANVKQPAMQWSSSPAKDGNGSPIPTLDNSNL